MMKQTHMLISADTDGVGHALGLKSRDGVIA